VSCRTRFLLSDAPGIPALACGLGWRQRIEIGAVYRLDQHGGGDQIVERRLTAFLLPCGFDIRVLNGQRARVGDVIDEGRNATARPRASSGGVAQA